MTSELTILIPSTGDTFEGIVSCQQGRERLEIAVRRFSTSVLRKQGVKYQELDKVMRPHDWKAFRALGNLLQFARGTKIDQALFLESSGALLGDYYSPQLVEALRAAHPQWQSTSTWLPAIFNDKVRKARFVLWWQQWRKGKQVRGEFRPAIFCPDHQTALIVSLIFANISACLGCHALFQPSRPDQLFHDNKCGNLWRKRRERMRKRNRGSQAIKQKRAAPVLSAPARH